MATPTPAAAWLMAAAFAVAGLAAGEAGDGGSSAPPRAPTGAGAAPEGTPARVRREISLTSLEEVAAGGLFATGKVTAVDGGMRLEGPATLALDPARWLPAAGNPEGWAVEARVRPLTEAGPCARAEVTVVVWDGRSYVVARFGGSEVGLFAAGSTWSTRAIPASGAARAYRLELQGDRVWLSVDGVEALSADLTSLGAPEGPHPAVTFAGATCSGAASQWEAVAWETAPRPIPEGLDPKVIHPGVESAPAMEALASGLSGRNAAAVRALSPSPSQVSCAARTAVDDAIRLGARRAFQALARPPTEPGPVDLGLQVEMGQGGCPAPPMPGREVMERARLAARALAKLTSTLDAGGLDRARAALAAPSPRPPEPPPPIDVLELLGDKGSRQRRGPICDPAGPCDCRPRPSPAFPFPAEVTAATEAAALVDHWPDHPRYVYDALRSASAALTAPADQAQLAAHLKAVASGKRTCATRP